MEINPDVRAGAAYTAANEGTSDRARPAQQALPAEGSVVSGKIADLGKDTVTLVTPDGVVTAGLRGGAGDVRIGDTASFTVRQDSAGNPVLELNRLPSEAVQKALVSDALALAGFKSSPENIEMALKLLNNGIPLTKENLAKMNQALKLLGADKAQEALFMIKNDLKIGIRTAETLGKLLAGEAKLLGQINSLESKIASIGEPALREQLTKLFQNADPAGNALKEVSSEINNPASGPDKAAARIARAFGELPPESLGKFAEGLKQLFDTAKDGIPGRPGFVEALARELSAQTKSQPAAQGAEAAAKNMPENQPATAQATSAPAGNNETAAVARVESAKQAITGMLESKAEIFKLLEADNEGFARLAQAVKDGTANPGKTEDLLKFLKLPIKAEDLTPNELKYIAERLTAETEGKNASAKPAAADKLRFEPRTGEPAEIDRFLNGLRESLASARGELAKHTSPEAAGIMKEIADITSNIELTAQLRNNLFIQLPVAINSHEINAELFVFKDGKKKKKGGASTALIALDTVNLGRTETYIQKTGSSVNLQFRIKSDEVEQIITRNLDKLNEGLKAHNLDLQVYSFKRLTEDFTPLNEPGELDGEPGEAQVSNNERQPTVFDLRL